MSEPIYSRAPDVVWRLGPDRVLVRRIGVRGEDAAAELLGGAALVWVALDEPGSSNDVAGRVPAFESVVAEASADQLVAAGWIVAA